MFMALLASNGPTQTYGTPQEEMEEKNAILNNFLDSGFIIDWHCFLYYFSLLPKFYVDKWNENSKVCLSRRNLISGFRGLKEGYRAITLGREWSQKQT